MGTATCGSAHDGIDTAQNVFRLVFWVVGPCFLLAVTGRLVVAPAVCSSMRGWPTPSRVGQLHGASRDARELLQGDAASNATS